MAGEECARGFRTGLGGGGMRSLSVLLVFRGGMG